MCVLLLWHKTCRVPYQAAVVDEKEETRKVKDLHGKLMANGCLVSLILVHMGPHFNKLRSVFKTACYMSV